MPKKTKKQKIIAAYRKKIMKLKTVTQPTTTTVTPVKIKTKTDTSFPNENEIKISSPTTAFFMADFRKSIFLSFMIIALEIIFYYARIYNYLKLE